MTQSPPAILTEEELATFERDGYLVIDPEIPPEVMDGAIRDVAPKYTEKGTRHEDDVIYQRGRITHAWRFSENVLAIATAPRVLQILQELFGCRMVGFQTLNFWIGTQQAPHSDAMHFRPKEPKMMCGVWVALEDIDMSNGPLIYYPGSHLLPFLDYDEVDFKADRSEFDTYEAFIHLRNRAYQDHVLGLLEEHKFEPRYGTIRRGQALVWAANILHGGAPQEDRTLTRHSQVTHYLPERSFAYHTPMRTEGGQEFWTEPEMIQTR
jgi:ectoine hydroxylase-related dioxygenase (phytanoyl-CoA dioxygenase family)